MMDVRVCVMALAAVCGLACSADAAPRLTEKIAAQHQVMRTDMWHGFDRTVFDFDGYEAWVVEPRAGTERKGRPWTWTMQWATAFVPRTGVPKLLSDGYHHVTIITFKDKMDAKGLAESAKFQKYLVDELGFAPKADLIGMSWGGFFSTRYAVNYPENVDKIYLDAPLLSFADMQPGQKLKFDIGPWREMAPADGKWSAHPEMPLNLAEKLAKTGIPVFLVYGGQDQSCPAEQNAIPFIKRFKAAGGEKNLKVLYRSYFGHHPHGMEVGDLTIVKFFEEPFVPCEESKNILGEVSVVTAESGVAAVRAAISGGEITRIAGHDPQVRKAGGLGSCTCKVTVVEFTLTPTAESAIHCRLLLPPVERWDGRFWGIGNCGYGDNLGPMNKLMLPRVHEGSAACIADMGTADGRHGREVIRDFGWRAAHLMTVQAKKMVAAFYGRSAGHSYFYGVSSGGGQGLHEAQRFPEDYDGIVAYVPAHCRTELVRRGREDYRAGKRKDKNFMNRVLAGVDAVNEYDMDDATFETFVESIRTDVDATSVDLDAFVARGGKLMVVSALEDRIVPSDTARSYCQALSKRYGGVAAIAPFFRAYFLPGRGHTRATRADGVVDISSAAVMVAWVEKNVAPGSLTGWTKDGGKRTVEGWRGDVPNKCLKE